MKHIVDTVFYILDEPEPLAEESFYSDPGNLAWRMSLSNSEARALESFFRLNAKPSYGKQRSVELADFITNFFNGGDDKCEFIERIKIYKDDLDRMRLPKSRTQSEASNCLKHIGIIESVIRDDLLDPEESDLMVSLDFERLNEELMISIKDKGINLYRGLGEHEDFLALLKKVATEYFEIFEKIKKNASPDLTLNKGYAFVIIEKRITRFNEALLDYEILVMLNSSEYDSEKLK